MKLVKSSFIAELSKGNESILFNPLSFKPLYIQKGRERVKAYLDYFSLPRDASSADEVFPDLAGFSDILAMHDILIHENCDEEAHFIPGNTHHRCSGGDRDPVSRAMTLYLLMSQSCNLGCVYCLNGDETYRNKGVLSMAAQVAEQSIRFCCRRLSEGGSLEIVFFGGEPLLNWDTCKDVIIFTESVIKKERPDLLIRYHLTSNLTILPDDLIEWAKRYGITFLCDIDGPESLHNKLRPGPPGMNSFMSSANIIEKLTGAGLGVALRATITSQNVDYMVEIARTHRSLGGVNSAFVPLNPVNSDEVILDKGLYPSPSAYEKGLRDVFASDAWDDPESIYPFNHIKEQITSFSKNRHGCGAPYGNTPVVTTTGEVYPCIYWVGIDALKIGDIYRGYSEAGLRTIRELLDLCDVNAVKGCRQCMYRFICGGGCPVRRVTVYSNPRASTETIKYADQISCVHSRVPIEEILWRNAKSLPLEPDMKI